MKGYFKLFSLALALLVLFSNPLNAGYIYNQDADKDNPIISVSGDAEIWVAPDEVTIYAGVSIFASKLDSATTAVDERINKILKLKDEFNIESRHVKTDHIYIMPDHDYRSRAFIGYWVKKSVTFTLKDPNIFDQFMQELVDAGANVIHDVSFRTLELKKYREQARALAIKAAREKAEKLSSEIGQSIGKAIKISEDKYYYGYWGYNRWWDKANISTSQTSIQAMDYDAPEPEGSFAVGQIRVFASVNAVFELK